ncbi:MAG: PepSY-like domain-containing protein [Bacteroidales bacterium]|nr:PepSY-like domain-containing protein [Candidatus Sodaliphilus aphodohippi]
MKKIVSTLVIAILACFFATTADADTPIKANQLPTAARQFIKKTFPNQTIIQAKKDRDLLSIDYEVILSNGVSIDFDSKGNWTEVDCHKGTVPSSLVPSAIAKKAKQLYKNASITKIEKGKLWKVDLNNGMELEFNSAFKLVKIDD